MRKLLKALILALVIVPYSAFAESAVDIVDKTYSHMRGKTSVGVIEMIIHRPDFERSMTVKSWSKGRSDGIFYITKPKKDAGNGTLKKGRKMWTYNPAINRIVKLPPSMMGQSWMGSDFSNNDLSKTESMIDDYNHTIISKENGVYSIKSIPKEGAAVVWGKVEMKIREDYILLKQKFFDQDMVGVKELSTSDIREADGRLFPMLWVMKNLEEDDRYTTLKYHEIEFDTPLSDRLFTTTYLKRVGG